jgi:hypothetical protein
LDLAVMTVTHGLATDWNLISLSLEPSAPALPGVLESITGTYDVVWAFDGCKPAGQQWTLYNPASPVNTLKVMDGQRGYWLLTTSAVDLTAVGLRPLTTDITLCVGWNLIGYPAPLERAVQDVLAPISGKYNLVYGYDAADTGDPWKVYDPVFPVGNTLETMQPGWGYWIHMTQSATLTVHSR